VAEAVQDVSRHGRTLSPWHGRPVRPGPSYEHICQPGASTHWCAVVAADARTITQSRPLTGNVQVDEITAA
jgi:hypothetical protein